jgi:hypothetical protein
VLQKIRFFLSIQRHRTQPSIAALNPAFPRSAPKARSIPA